MSMMGEMKFFLGVQIHQSPSGIFINQSTYALEILKKHGMETCDSIDTLMATSPKLDVDLQGVLVDQRKYHGMVGSLMYLTISRPDIHHVLCICARYQASPTESHLKEWLDYHGTWVKGDARLSLVGFQFFIGCSLEVLCVALDYILIKIWSLRDDDGGATFLIYSFHLFSSGS
ncbi:hypothetical protein Tco_1428229 [Tanacetum coccineum]